jgi:hypothetical protein
MKFEEDVRSWRLCGLKHKAKGGVIARCDLLSLCTLLVLL